MHENIKKSQSSVKYKKIALVGNPNVGKSVIFGLLTGKYVTVSNYPGTTVEVSQGNVSLDGKMFVVVDTPGVNSLMPMSEDERVTRDILLKERPEVVLQVGDSKNLKRTLLLTLQLAEMGMAVTLCLNMEDEAMNKGIVVDARGLKDMLGIDVVSTVAPERKGLKGLRSSLFKENYKVPAVRVEYTPVIEDYISKLSEFLPDSNVSKRSLAVMILSGDESLGEWLKLKLDVAVVDKIEAMRDECRVKCGKPVGTSVSEARMRLVEEISSKVISKSAPEGGALLNYIGRMSMHPFWGIFVLLGVLLGFYEFVGVFGAGTLVDFMEETIFGEYLNPMFTWVVNAVIPFKILREMFVGNYGLITMALTYAIGIILPITTTFFIAFSILEDSGYLPRLAIMSNRVFNIMGLSGKAVLPMVLGLGCGTMAVMTTRILETPRDRLIAAFLLALAVPCSAQLGVILGMLGGLSIVAVIIWITTILGVLLLGGYLASKIVPGSKSEFFLEIPPIRRPALQNIAIKTWSRAVWYLKEAVPLFLLGTFVLFVLDKLLILKVIERFASPIVVHMLGLPAESTSSFLIGFFRRDYGAAGFYAMAEKGLLTPAQTLVSLVTLTLFIPCLAHLLMTIKEMGARYALVSAGIVFSVAVITGSALNWTIKLFGLTI